MFKKKTRATILAAGLVIILTIGTVFAYYSQKLSAANHFNTGDVGVGLTESCDYKDGWVPGEEKSNEVFFDNTGDYDFLIRARFNPEITKGGNKVSDKAIIGSFKLNFASDFDDLWVQLDDGWYYYKRVLKKHTTTPITLKSVTMSDHIGNTNKDGAHEDYSGANLKILVDCESIQRNAQAEQYQASGWKVPVSVQEDKVVWK